MIRIVAFSDSHGAEEKLEDAVRHAYSHGRVDMLLFLGDGVREWERVCANLPVQYPQANCRYVMGNNDLGCRGEDEILFSAGKAKVFACHGQWLGVKTTLTRLLYKAMEQEANIAFYGHTHVSRVDEVDGVLLVNPGSVRDAYRMRSVAYAEVLVSDNGKATARLVHWDD